MAGKGVPLLKQGERFVRREVLSAMEVVARRNQGIIKVSEVQEVLRKRGWKISYNTLSRIVKEEIKGTGWRLYSDVRRRRR